MNSTLEIFSKGLYSSWCYHKPSRTLFDCGEGYATYQGNFIFGVERVMISHGHEDHVLGLLSLVTVRNLARGDHEKPLDIYYPINDVLCEQIRELLTARVGGRLKYRLRWFPIPRKTGVVDVVRISNTQTIQAFPMEHQRNGATTLGYRIVESRNQLKPEFKDKDIPTLLASKQVKKEDLTVVYNANVFAYCLDAFSFDTELIKDCNTVIMDTTFLRKEDRDDPTHFTYQEALDICINAGVKRMVAAHLSPRYTIQEFYDTYSYYSKDCPVEVDRVIPHKVNEF